MPNEIVIPAADRPDGLTGTYERGVWRKLKRVIRLNYTQEELTGPPVLRGPMLLENAVQFLEGKGHLPFTTLNASGDPVDTLQFQPLNLTAPIGNPDCPFSNLVLVGMNPRIVSQNNWVDVELDYEHIMDGYNQILLNPPSRRIFVKARSSVVEKPTNFYYPRGDKAAGKRLIKTAHTFITEETGIPNAPFHPDLPRTVVWSGEVNIPFPAQNFGAQGMWFTDNIWEDAGRMVGHINTEVILGKPAYTYLCTEFTWELHSAFKRAWQRGKGAYKVSMEFQFNFDTWNPTVVFHDQRVNAAPADIRPALTVDGDGVFSLTVNPINFTSLQPAGYWDVPALPHRNFSNFLGDVQFEIVGPGA